MTSLRTGGLTLRGNKNADEHRNCRHCEVEENEEHILLNCNIYQDARETMYERLQQIWNYQQWEHYNEAEDHQKRMILAGKRLQSPTGETNRQMWERDLVIKQALEEINDTRTDTMGWNSMTSKTHQDVQTRQQKANLYTFADQYDEDEEELRLLRAQAR